MAAPQDYDGAPWATSSSSLRSIAPSALNGSSPSVTSTRNNAALLQQLAEAHAAQQALERRLEDQERESEARLQQQTRENNHRVAQLQKKVKEELAEQQRTFREEKREILDRTEQQKRDADRRIMDLEKNVTLRQKREAAIKAVFFREFEKERELLMLEQKLDEKWKALGKRREQLTLSYKRLEEAKLELDERLALASQHEEANDTNDDDPSPNTPPRRPGQTNPFTYGNTKLLDLHKLNPHRHAWALPSADISMQNKHLALLRKHDYYAGWLDAMKSLDHQKALVTALQPQKPNTRAPLPVDMAHFQDRNDPRNPTNAGVNAGLLFAHAALCSAHNLPEHDVRLDTRQWALASLKPLALHDAFGEYAFWDGVDFAVEKMTRLFTLKIERGIWKTGEDAAQIALLKNGGVRRRDEVVLGRRIVQREVQRLGRRARGDDEG
tara:strand:- start:1428 stop:2747 length:1320 start_codon:yes stop_codon:yes gene_type:complete